MIAFISFDSSFFVINFSILLRARRWVFLRKLGTQVGANAPNLGAEL